MNKFPDVYAIPGVRVYSGRLRKENGKSGASFYFHEKLETGRKDFWVFFHPIFSKLENFFWLDSDRPSIQTSAEGKVLLPRSEELIFDKPGYIDDYAKITQDDGDVLCGFSSRSKAVTASQAVSPSLRSLFEPQCIAGCDILFQNFDGVYWACYTRDADVLATLKRHLSTVNAKVVEATFRESVEVHRKEDLAFFSNWRSKPDQCCIGFGIPELPLE